MLKILRKSFANPSKISIREALRLAMVEEMKRDPKVFLIGEEVGYY